MKQYEFDIHQNSALSALALWSFVSEHASRSKHKEGPDLILAYCVLPLAYDIDVSTQIQKMQMDSSGLYRLLPESQDLVIGLQEKMERMFDQTNSALNVAFATKLVGVDPETLKLISLRTTDIEIDSGEYKRIGASAKRLGAWFSAFETYQVMGLLKIAF